METFGIDLFPIGHEEDEGYDENDGSVKEEEATNNEIDNIVGFGSANMSNVEQLIELANIDLKGKQSEDVTKTTTDYIMRDLHVVCVINSSK